MGFLYDVDGFCFVLVKSIPASNMNRILHRNYLATRFRILLKIQLKYSAREKILSPFGTQKKGGVQKIFSISFNFPFIKHRNGKTCWMKRNVTGGIFLSTVGKTVPINISISIGITYKPKRNFFWNPELYLVDSMENCWFFLLVIFIGSFRCEARITFITFPSNSISLLIQNSFRFWLSDVKCQRTSTMLKITQTKSLALKWMDLMSHCWFSLAHKNHETLFIISQLHESWKLLVHIHRRKSSRENIVWILPLPTRCIVDASMCNFSCSQMHRRRE